MIETVEHNNRFYTNEKGEIKTENEQLKEWLTIANKENERLNNIIKEVRELLNQEWYSVLRKETIRKVREILDKENNNV